MNAVIFHERGRISVDDVPIPHPNPNETLIRVKAALIYASDLRIFKENDEERCNPGT